MFLGYLLNKNGSIIGELYYGTIDNSVGVFGQSLILLFMGIYALASSYLHVVDIGNCLTHIPFFWVLLICFSILNVFNARRILESNEHYFSQIVSTITSGSIIGGFLLSMAYKPYYLQFHNHKTELIDGVGRFLGSIFIVSVICILTLIFGFIIAASIKFDSNSILSKIIFSLVVTIFIVGSFITISLSRNIAENNTSNYVQEYSKTQMEQINSLDMYDDNEYTQINEILTETYETLKNDSNKKYSNSELETFYKYEEHMHKLRSYLTDSENYKLDKSDYTHFSFFPETSSIAIEQGNECAILTYNTNKQYSIIRGKIETYNNDSINYKEAYFEILADGHKIYNSGKIETGKDTEFNVNINYAKEVEIKFYTNLNESYSGAMYQITHFYVEE